MKKNCVFLHQYEIDNSAAQASAGDISLREYQQSGSERRSRTMNRLLRTTGKIIENSVRQHPLNDLTRVKKYHHVKKGRIVRS